MLLKSAPRCSEHSGNDTDRRTSTPTDEPYLVAGGTQLHHGHTRFLTPVQPVKKNAGRWKAGQASAAAFAVP
jgi:hypothetical protein